MNGNEVSDFLHEYEALCQRFRVYVDTEGFQHSRPVLVSFEDDNELKLHVMELKKGDSR